MLPIVVCIDVIGVRGVGQSVNWDGGVVIRQVFGGWDNIVGLMVGSVRVVWFFVGVMVGCVGLVKVVAGVERIFD